MMKRYCFSRRVLHTLRAPYLSRHRMLSGYVPTPVSDQIFEWMFRRPLQNLARCRFDRAPTVAEHLLQNFNERG